MRYTVTIKFKQDFVKVEGNEITIGVKSHPEKGRANEEALKKIAKHFGLARSRVRIISGALSRKKIIEVDTTKNRP